MADGQSHITLFNDERYQRCNLQPGQRLFRYDHVAGGRLVGTLSGVVDGGLLDCGHSAPFGGIDLARSRESGGTVVELLRAAICRARAEGIGAVRVRARPGYFGPNESVAEFALVNLGAEIESCELTLGVETWRYRDAEEYVEALRCFGRNRLKHGRGAGFVFSPAAAAGDWAACYDLLAATKRRRGARFKMSLDYILRLRELFGDRIAMYRLTVADELAAAALVYRVAPQWDCLVAWGDDLDHRDRNVMNVLAYALMCRAIHDRISVVELGISSVDGVPDDGLIRFKRGVGAATGLRLNFRLAL
jgi:hypothetical protein